MIRRPRTERTRRRLLDAGRTLFARHGPAGVTSHEIAAAAGLASGTFYLHFKDKGELFRELTDQAANELESRLVAAAALGSDQPTIVAAQAEALVGFAHDHRELFRIVFAPGGEGAEAGARVLERLARGVRARRRAAVARGQAWTCLDADVLAQAIVGMWVRVLSWWVDDPSRASRAEIVRTLGHFQLHGSRPSGDAPDCKPTRSIAPRTGSSRSKAPFSPALPSAPACRRRGRARTTRGAQ